MRIKAVSGLMMTLLSISMLTLTLEFCVQLVKASGTIYIRPDGSIDPPTANITTSDYYLYTFTGNNLDEVVVQRDNIIIDGRGFTLQGPDSGYNRGFYLDGRTGVTIRDVIVKGWRFGIMVNHTSTEITITENNITDNFIGVDLYDESRYNSVYSNNVTENDYGISVGYAEYNNVFENNVTDNISGMWIGPYANNNTFSDNNVKNNSYYGTFLYTSGDNELRRNTMVNNTYNFGVSMVQVGTQLWMLRNDVDPTNTVDGKPIYYWINHQNDVVPSDAGYVALVNCANITVENLNLTRNSGVELAWTSNSRITGNNITDHECGIWLFSSSSNNITKNNIENSDSQGIWIETGSSNLVSECTVKNNTRGIMVYKSPLNTISRNNITESQDYGVQLHSSSYNSLFGNNISNGTNGIKLNHAVDNSVYHNAFINNTHQVFSYDDSNNTWDNGYPSGGNYWSNYIDLKMGEDWYRGPFQNETGSDGMGDTPYIIDANDQDRYPLMKPYPWDPYDVGVTRINSSKTIVGQGFTLELDITVLNYGLYTETFNVTVYLGSTTITPEQWETFWSVGDVNRNGFINHYDVDLIMDAFGSMPGDPNWCPWADLNQDLIVDTSDLAICSPRVGWNIWTYFMNPTTEQWITFWSMGDVNWDGYIDDADGDLIMDAFGSMPGDPNWNPDADINKDLVVDSGDLAIWSFNYGLDIWTYFDRPVFALIGTQTVVDLPSLTSAILTFTWDTTDVAYDNYIISAYAVPILCNETCRVDNNYGDWEALVTIPGDVDGDGDVDGFDLTRLCGAYGSSRGDPAWDEECDINGDGVIDGFDLTPSCGNYGKTLP